MVSCAPRRLCVECFEPRLLLAVDFATHEIPIGDGILPTFGDVADFDDDGDLDILMTVYLDPEDRDSKIIVWYENTDGHGDYGERHAISAMEDDHPYVPYAGDLDNDGDEDVITRMYRGVGDVRIVWYENMDGNGDFGPQREITNDPRGAPRNLVVVDIDHDGDLDVLYDLKDSQDDLTEIVLRENTDGRGSFGPPQTIIEYIGANCRPAADDLDGDGDVDVVVARTSQGPDQWSPSDYLAWFENTDGAGDLGSEHTIYDVGEGNFLAAFGVEVIQAHDLDGDGDLDVLASYQDSNFDQHNVYWYENRDGRGTFGRQRLITTDAPLAGSLDAADLDKDGDLDVLSASRYDGKIAWYENVNGRGTFGPQQIIQTGARLTNPSVYAADFDGDGDLDVLSVFEGVRLSDRPSGEADGFFWHENLLPRIPGDANRDGFFDTADLVQVLQAGEYEDGIEDNSTWTEGDWDGDFDFGTSDLVLALQTGLYEVKSELNASQIAAAVDWLFTQPDTKGTRRAFVA